MEDARIKIKNEFRNTFGIRKAKASLELMLAREFKDELLLLEEQLKKK